MALQDMTPADLEAVIAASESLGRPLCIRGLCAGV